MLPLPKVFYELMVQCDASGGRLRDRTVAREANSFFKPSTTRETTYIINIQKRNSSLSHGGTKVAS
jgi:hypothetical protein